MHGNEQVLFEECQLGNFENIQSLLDAGISSNAVQPVNVKNSAISKELSILCLAAFEGYLEIVKLLLQRGANVNYRCKLGESALFLAVRKGHLKVTQVLLDAGAQSVYVAKPGDKVLCENWEVFTQALQSAYPHDIRCFENSQYKAVAQLLLEHSATSQRPNVLYEALYCSLTVFANPIAVYCVGTYCTLCSDAPTLVFCEQNFLSALCNAFEMSQASDFITTIYSVLVSSKMRQKDIAQNLVKLFNWCDLLRRVAEDMSQVSNNVTETGKILCQLMRVFQIFVAHLNVRVDIQEKFQMLSADDIGKIGRLIKFALEHENSADRDAVQDKSCTWQFFFFLLKQQFRCKQEANVARLLLRSGWKRNQDQLSSQSQASSDFEKKVLLKCIEDDISLGHALIDFGVSLNGECLVKFIQHGLVDLVDRCKNFKELLFCKEVDSYLKVPLAVKNSSNRNIRRCIKIIKSQRNAVEDERRKNEEELLFNEPAPCKKNKKRKSRSQAKKVLSVEVIDETPELLEVKLPYSDPVLKEEDSELFAKEDYLYCGDAELQPPLNLRNGKSKSCKNRTTDISVSKKVQMGTVVSHSDDTQNIEEEFEVKKGSNAFKKKRNKKKAVGKKKEKNFLKHEKEERSPNEAASATRPQARDASNGWREIIQIASRRRRQSSSSSDCSIGPRKSVHFSHPLTFYESTKSQESSFHRLSKENFQKPSNLKQPVLDETTTDFKEAYRTALVMNDGSNTGDASFQNVRNDISSVTSAFTWMNSEVNYYGTIPWRSVSQRWAPRLEDLSEMDMDNLKQLHWTNTSGKNEIVYFCDNQKHLHLGAGPDYSNSYLGLTNSGEEVSIKKVSCKRAPLMASKAVADSLTHLAPCEGISEYQAIIKDKSHCYVIQAVGEYSLLQVVRKKMSILPHSKPIQACYEMAKGLESLHNQNIVHMAIKPTNVFLRVNKQLYLADYGIHKRLVTSTSKCTLSPESASMCWMAREALSSENDPIFTKESDIASLGMLMFYIITGGCHPFGDPDTVPGVCLSNIMRGTYNLKSLTDPLVHHLVQNMIFKEPEKRFSIKQVVDHPCFWSVELIDNYIVALTDTALSGAKLNDGRSVMEMLEKEETSLLDGRCNLAKLLDAPEIYLTSVKGVLTLLYDCMHSEDLYAQYATVDETSPQQYFCLCFPGLLIHTYQLFTLEELETAALGCGDPVVTPPLSPAPTCECDHQCTILSTLLEDTPNYKQSHSCMNIKAADSVEISTIHISEINAKQQMKQSVAEDEVYSCNISNISLCNDIVNGRGDEIRPKTTKSTFLSKDKKNISLCLSTPTLDVPQPNESNESVHSIAEPEYILLSEDLDFNANMLGQDLSETDSAVDHSNGFSHIAKFTSIKQSDPSSQAQAVSPDDWIDVGSPMEIEQSSNSNAKPVFAKHFDLSDDSPMSVSSGGSVDDCFDFGPYPNSVDSTLGSLSLKDRDTKGKCNPRVNYNSANTSNNITCTCTDIDELD